MIHVGTIDGTSCVSSKSLFVHMEALSRVDDACKIETHPRTEQIASELNEGDIHCRANLMIRKRRCTTEGISNDPMLI